MTPSFAHCAPLSFTADLSFLFAFLCLHPQHSWGGCPTWQLSRFCLGLAPRFELGARHFELALHIGTKLDGVSGTVPARDGDAVSVSWARKPATKSFPAGQVAYTLTATTAISVLGWPSSPKTWLKLQGEETALFAEQDVI